MAHGRPAGEGDDGSQATRGRRRCTGQDGARYFFLLPLFFFFLLFLFFFFFPFSPSIDRRRLILTVPPDSGQSAYR
ncbi:hypothetical protein GW17_00012550 [Ensete ventricosum]|nr:hypothetical protein GW17_00012550 [Ensete ventricosum]